MSDSSGPPATPEERLAELDLELPGAPEPAAAYAPWVAADDLVFVAGQVPVDRGKLVATGRLGDDLTTDEGQQLAHRCAVNLLAVARDAAGGSLDGVRVLSLTVYVASAPEFTEQHLVANGASLLLADVLGEQGQHARSAVGVACLPLDSPVEVDATLRV